MKVLDSLVDFNYEVLVGFEFDPIGISGKVPRFTKFTFDPIARTVDSIPCTR